MCNDECRTPFPRRSSGAMNECPSTGGSDGDALSLLRDAVRHARGPECVNVLGLRRQQFSRQQRGALRQRVVGSRHPGPSRSAAQSADAQCTRRVGRHHLGGSARSRGPGHPARAGTSRRGRGRRLRQRRVDERESLPARQVRARGAAHGEHRLQRALLHVLGGCGSDPRIRPRSRPSIPARGHRARERRAARRQQRRRDHATADAVLLCPADQRRQAAGDRPPPIGHRGVGVDPPAAATGIGHGAGQRHPPCPHRRTLDRHGLYRQPDGRIRRSAAARRDLLA